MIGCHINLSLSSDNLFSQLGFPASLLLCQVFRICAQIMFWLETSILFLLYRILSCTVYCSIPLAPAVILGVWSMKPVLLIGCLWISGFVCWQWSLCLSQFLVKSYWFSGRQSQRCLACHMFVYQGCQPWTSAWCLPDEMSCLLMNVSENISSVIFVGVSSWQNVSLSPLNWESSGYCDRVSSLVEHLLGWNLISNSKHPDVSLVGTWSKITSILMSSPTTKLVIRPVDSFSWSSQI